MEYLQQVYLYVPGLKIQKIIDKCDSDALHQNCTFISVPKIGYSSIIWLEYQKAKYVYKINYSLLE